MLPRRSLMSLFLLLWASAFRGATAQAATRRRRRRRASPLAPRSAAASATETDIKAEFIQPDYARWRQVKLGMQRSEVLALLGAPLYREDQDPDFENTLRPPQSEATILYRWDYGHLDFADPVMPTPFTFAIYFAADSHDVQDIQDPFHGQLSSDGRPTVPRLIMPLDGSLWSHYPRYLDLRWEPSSGIYPIRYEIECAFAQHIFDGVNASLEYRPLPSETSAVPHHTISFVGKQQGRWRVRAHNRLGSSQWSDYWHFKFDV